MAMVVILLTACESPGRVEYYVNTQDTEEMEFEMTKPDGTTVKLRKTGQSASNPINAAAETNKLQAEAAKALIDKL